MATFEVIPLSEAPARPTTNATTSTRNELDDYVVDLLNTNAGLDLNHPDFQVGNLNPDPGQTMRSLKMQSKHAARRNNANLEYYETVDDVTNEPMLIITVTEKPATAAV